MPDPSSRLAGLLRALAPSLGLGRTAVGLVMLARPRLVPEVLGTGAAAAAQTSWVLQMLGAREVALGLGAFRAGRTGSAAELRPWVAGGVLSDGVDAVAVAYALGRGHLRSPAAVGLVAVACTAVAIGAAGLVED